MAGDTTVEPCPHVCVRCGGCPDCCPCTTLQLPQEEIARRAPDRGNVLLARDENFGYGKSPHAEWLRSQMLRRGASEDAG